MIFSTSAVNCKFCDKNLLRYFFENWKLDPLLAAQLDAVNNLSRVLICQKSEFVLLILQGFFNRKFQFFEAKNETILFLVPRIGHK
jgi:hypothetical protein